MKYQLVLQFRATSTEDLDDLIVLEELLIKSLPSTAEIDGHDFGNDEFNIFVLTDLPKEIFTASEKIIQRYNPRQQLNAAYRKLDEEEFKILWPPNLSEFKVTWVVLRSIGNASKPLHKQPCCICRSVNKKPASP